MAEKGPRPLKIYLLTGGSGQTGDHVLKAALAQFSGPQPEIVRRLKVRSVAAAVKTVNAAATENAVLFHTVVVPEVREALIEAATQKNVLSVDLLGPTLRVLEDYLESPPTRQPGLLDELEKERRDRIDAVDFTLSHDDGCLIGELPKADVVLVGVSRVSKSVTCFYLAYRGIRAANVPLLGEREPPDELVRLDPQKVVGLTMNAHRLVRLREARAEALGGGSHQYYVDKREVARELRHADAVIQEHNWRCLDVSYTSVEEVASEIARMIRP